MDQTLAAQAESLFGLQLDQAQLEACAHYVALLDDWNTRINLTAISDAAAVRVRHFLDSFSITSAFRFTPGLTMIDVGTGAGFPGLPLKIAYPASKLTLLEATGKKVAI
jgi:16S rRNA (guanine527-N7)-methyltransferase